jgi:hypothetical protein
MKLKSNIHNVKICRKLETLCWVILLGTVKNYHNISIIHELMTQIQNIP